jgi:hypothetical protein
MKTRTPAQRTAAAIKFHKEQIRFSKKYSDSKRSARNIKRAEKSIAILTSDKPTSFITTAQKRTIGKIVKTAKGYYSYSGKIFTLSDITLSVNEHGGVRLSFDTDESANHLLDKHIFAIIGPNGGLHSKIGTAFSVSSIFSDTKVTTSLFEYEMKAAQTKDERLANEAWRKKALARFAAERTAKETARAARTATANPNRTKAGA